MPNGTMTRRLYVGMVVRWKHDYPKKEVACDTGMITAERRKFAKTSLEKRYFTVRFDYGVFKRPVYSQVYELLLPEESLAAVRAKKVRKHDS